MPKVSEKEIFTGLQLTIFKDKSNFFIKKVSTEYKHRNALLSYTKFTHD